MTPSKISERESNTTRTRTYTGPTGAVSDLSGLSTKTRCSYVRPRQQRRLCVAVAIVQQQQQQQQYSEERRRSRLSPSSSSSLPIGLSSTLPLFLTLMALSLVSIEKIPLQTLAFSNSNSNIHGSNNNNRNDFRSRIPTIRTRISGTGGAFYGSGNTSRGTAAATSTTTARRRTTAYKHHHQYYTAEQGSWWRWPKAATRSWRKGRRPKCAPTFSAGYCGSGWEGSRPRHGPPETCLDDGRAISATSTPGRGCWRSRGRCASRRPWTGGGFAQTGLDDG
mmetsp:Transcript_16708/g.34898  ORF Transcript_16708/g.34898 Transcript_16708/m.34898 type:complete len:279 (+) Transcript_16708:173-1009(+)